jgi:hypothetical protein
MAPKGQTHAVKAGCISQAKGQRQTFIIIA